MPFSKADEAMRIGIVADDLTGAGDTGVQFTKQGWTTYVFSPLAFVSKREVPRGRREFADIPVLVINTQSRNLAAREAYRRAGLAFSLVRDRQLLYKKVDSSLRGNIGAEIDAAIKATGTGRVLFCAAYPAFGRVTLDGVHYIGQEELSSTEASRDPKAPVPDSQVCRILARQSKRRIAAIKNRSLTSEVPRLAELLEESYSAGNQVLACDALSDQDLESLARVALDSQSRPLLAGSAGFAGQLAGLLPASGSSAVRAPAARMQDGAVLVVSGSTSAINEEQLRHLADREGTNFFVFALEQLLQWKGAVRSERKAIRDSLGQLLDGRRTVVVAIKPEAWGRNARAGEISAAFGELLAELLRGHRQKIRGLVLTGGETAELLFQNLGARGVWLISEVEAGIPAGLVDGGVLEGLPVITKAGALGREDTLTNCAQYLAEGLGGGCRA